MDTKELTAILVVAMVGCVIVAGFVPVVGESVTASTTFANDGYYTMDKLDENTARVIEWEKASPNQITIDGEPFLMSFAELNKSYTLVGSETLILRYQAEATTTGLQVYSSEGYVSFHLNTSADNGDKVTVTIENNTLSFVTNGTTPLTKTYTSLGTDGYIINGDGTGDYAVMKKSNVPANVLGDSNIRLIGVCVRGGPTGIAIYGNGTIDDGITLSTIYSASGITVTYSEPVANDTAVNGYVDLYKLNNYTFTITYTNGQDTGTYDATYSYFIVPVSVTAEKTIHADDNTASIISMVPFILIMGIVLMFISVVLVRRYV